MGVTGPSQATGLVQAVFGRDPHRVDRARGEGRDEERSPADVEHRVVEGDLVGEQAPGAGGRGLALGDPRHDCELAGQRDAHDAPGRDRDDAAVERGRRVVGVTLELGRGAQGVDAGFACTVPELRVHREQSGDACRGREAETASAGEARSHAERALAARVAKHAHGRMCLRRRFVAVGCHLEMNAERDGHRVERGTDVRGRRRYPNEPTVVHARKPRTFADIPRPIATVRRNETGTFKR